MIILWLNVIAGSGTTESTDPPVVTIHGSNELILGQRNVKICMADVNNRVSTGTPHEAFCHWLVDGVKYEIGQTNSDCDPFIDTSLVSIPSLLFIKLVGFDWAMMYRNVLNVLEEWASTEGTMRRNWVVCDFATLWLVGWWLRTQQKLMQN